VVIQIDSRERKNEHITAYFDAHKIKYVVSKMYVGDYQRIDNGLVCIDKKFGLDEVYNCVVKDYIRFSDECKRAKAAGVRLVMLIEDDTIASLAHVREWDNPRRKRWEKINAEHANGKKLKTKIPAMPPVSSDRIEKRMATLSKRYGVEWQFCRKEDTARRILEILGYED